MPPFYVRMFVTAEWIRLADQRGGPYTIIEGTEADAVADRLVNGPAWLVAQAKDNDWMRDEDAGRVICVQVPI